MPKRPVLSDDEAAAIGDAYASNYTPGELRALQKLRQIEDELREQASGSQDGYLLDVANRMREALRQFN